MQEQRRYQRAPLHANITVTHNSQAISGTSMDISVGGMFIQLEDEIPFGAEIQITMPSPIDAQALLTMPAKVRWTRAGGMGIQFGLLGALETHAIVEFLRGKIGT